MDETAMATVTLLLCWGVMPRIMGRVLSHA